MIAASKAMREGARIAPERSCAEFVDALMAINDGVDPVDKLEYLRSSLNLHPDSERALRYLPSSQVRRWCAQVIARAVLRRSRRHRIAIHPDVLHSPGRVPLLSVALSSLMCVALALFAARGLERVSPQLAPASVVHADTPPLASQASLSSTPAIALPERAIPPPESLAPAAAHELNANIWLVDKAEGWELYSNGLRVETAFEVDGELRQFPVFAGDRAEPIATQTQPVGILMHTSESDLWPLEAEFSTNIRASSRGLLRYVQRLKLYNYVIDRFGRVFRIVRDDTQAHHAGHGVWAHEDRYYLNLNSAMLGVCFETRWNGGRVLPITEAQLLAGRNLTAYLRQRYSIAPDMVVAHGLTSINPKSHLIGHHLDWARGFPFAAFGLPDQYQREPPSVAVFGFTYDAKFLQSMGEPWPGLMQAEHSLIEQARSLGMTPSALRARKQSLYDQWSRSQMQGSAAAKDTQDPHTAAQAALKS